MAIFQRIPVLRWIVPAATVALILAGSAVLGSVTADAATDLPARSAAQLLVDVQQSSVTGLSGTLVQTSDLGLPDLSGLGAAVPGMGGSASSNLTSLVSGTHTLRLWYAGPQQVRVALLGSLGESDVIRNDQNVWIWSSKDNTATHWTLPAASNTEAPEAAPLSMTPQQLAAAALAAIGPSTLVTTDSAATVAGRPAYELVLQPKDTRSLVAQVRIAIDAAEHVPLRVQIYAASQPDPVFQVAFSSVTFGQPDAAQFTFNPPPGATVTQEAGQPSTPAHSSSGAKYAASAADATKIVGTGWTQVIVINSPTELGSPTGSVGPSGPLPNGTSGTEAVPKTRTHRGADSSGVSLDRIMSELPTVSGTWGSGHLLTTKLVSVLITNNGRVAIGAVSPSLLYAAIAAK